MNLDIVIPFFNEEDCIEAFMAQLVQAIEQTSVKCIFYLVDDGSDDRTGQIIDDLAEKDPRINVIHLFGNHGHQKALIAGLDQCQGDAALMMDGDGEHPIEIAIEMINKFICIPGIAMIQGVRKGSQGNIIKDGTSNLFYWIMNKLMQGIKIEKGSSDFRILSREVLNFLRKYPDRYRNLRILLAQFNLPAIKIEYNISKRLSGKSKYNWKKMLKLATDGIFAFSTIPLRLSLFLMLGTGLLGFVYALYGLIEFMKDNTVPGWTSIIALTGLLFSAVFAVLAILAEYINRIYEEVRGRPIYNIRQNIFSKGNLNLNNTGASDLASSDKQTFPSKQ